MTNNTVEIFFLGGFTFTQTEMRSLIIFPSVVNSDNPLELLFSPMILMAARHMHSVKLLTVFQIIQ
jgi:hypothetical protein